MSRHTLHFLLLLCALLIPTLTSAQTPPSLRFHADIDYMMPQRYPSRNVSRFYFEMRSDTVELYLPYMGDVYTPTFTNEGLDFTAVANKLQYAKGKKGTYDIALQLRHDIVNYTIRLTLFPHGGIHLHLNPSNAQPISYSGTWEAIESMGADLDRQVCADFLSHFLLDF